MIKIDLKRVAVVLAKRSAIGKYKKGFSDVNIVDMTAQMIEKTVNKDLIKKIDTAIFGMVYQANRGQNVARQIALKAGLDKSSTAYTVNMVCGSGMKAVILGAMEILTGNSKVALVGGLESMSTAMYMLEDGLKDAIGSYHMGITAENVAKKYSFDRKTLDEFAFNSTKKAIKAAKEGKFDDEIVSMYGVDKDEHIRFDLSMEKLESLKPIFLENGVVTAGNSSGINDGAAILLLMEESLAKEENLEILGYIRSFDSCGLDPEYMGLGPIYSSRKLLEKEKLKIEDIDIFELNEAFASQSLAVIKELNIDLKKVNVNGGAIALGHPIGASGARILVSLISQMKKDNLKLGLASLCVGGGQGLSVLIER